MQRAAAIVHICIRLSAGPPFTSMIDAILSVSKWRLHTSHIAFNFKWPFRFSNPFYSLLSLPLGSRNVKKRRKIIYPFFFTFFFFFFIFIFFEKKALKGKCFFITQKSRKFLHIKRFRTTFFPIYT